ncbi:hypothetical protein, partial [Pseudonocardia sp.]|uniref:hypothetical protein n=1 Tax=Pseudonocardia sp. TaxID=60912 RepID=UPI0031FBFC58
MKAQNSLPSGSARIVQPVASSRARSTVAPAATRSGTCANTSQCQRFFAVRGSVTGTNFQVSGP